MGNVIERVDQVTAEWLTGVLRAQGALPCGKVAGVAPGPAQATFASSVWRLAVEYTREASAGAPRRLFLKVSNPALAPGAFDPQQLQREIAFYREAAPGMAAPRMAAPGLAAPFIIPCYSAAYDPETGAGHILLKDVSGTHGACLDPRIE